VFKLSIVDSSPMAPFFTLTSFRCTGNSLLWRAIGANMLQQMKKNGLLVIFLRFFENSSEELGMGNTRYFRKSIVNDESDER
jgi:hypothetical protein